MDACVTPPRHRRRQPLRGLVVLTVPMVLAVLIVVIGTFATPSGAAAPASATADGEPVDPEPAPSDPETPDTEPPHTDPGTPDTEPADPQAVDPAPVDPADPMSNEGPGEEAPATDVTVPPKDTYAGQEPYVAPPILWSSVAAAERKLEAATQDRRDAIADARALRKRRKELTGEQQELDAETQATAEELTRSTERLQTRAVFGYQWFGSGSRSTDDGNPNPADYAEVVEHQRKSKMIGSALTVDRSELARLADLEALLGDTAAGLLERARFVAEFLAAAELDAAALADEIEQATIEYDAFKAGSEVFIHGVVFPIAGDYEPPFDSFGFPRMPGTPDEHWHEGIDLFAPRGTPLVAVERGVITKVGIGRLGGLKFWLKGESGSEWYYAHLDSFAPDLVDGAVVETGQLVGYVGNTGNAVGTPPHLHMQLHPDGGRPVNPFPLLKVVSDLEQAALQAGQQPAYTYDAVVVDQPTPEPEPEPVATPEPEVTVESPPPTDAPVATEPPVSTETTVPPPSSTVVEEAGSPSPTQAQAPVEPAPTSTSGP